MSRPTNEAQYRQADQWMQHTFGSGMGDYVVAALHEPLSVALSDVDRILKVSGARQMLTRWRLEDARSGAGRKPFIDASGALGLLLLQMRINRPTLLTEMTQTVLKMSPRQRTMLNIIHDDRDDRLYERIWNAVHRLMGLVDEFPGRRDKILTAEEYRKVIAERDPEVCIKHRERMFTLANALVEAPWKLLPQEVRDRSHGNLAQDATLIPLLGKAGNPSWKVLNRKRRSINHDGGYYGRAGNHEGITHEDAQTENQQNPGAGKKGKSISKLTWGVETEIARLIPNLNDETDSFPLVTLGISFHRPGAIAGEGARMLKSMKQRGHRLNILAVDRAYPNGKALEFHIPAQLLGVKLVFDYEKPDLETQTYHPAGFRQVGGAWYLDNLPKVLKEADAVARAARISFERAMAPSRKNNSMEEAERAKMRKKAKQEYEMAQKLYDRQLAERRKYMLTRKGRMSSDGTRRYLIPTDAPGYEKWKGKAGAHQGKTLTMKLPSSEEFEEVNAGGLKREQYFPYQSPEWRHAYGKRNSVESANRNLKRGQFEDIANPDHRHVRGNTYTYLVVTMAAVVENLRKIIGFLKSKLALKTVTSKNEFVRDTYWQSSRSIISNELGPEPPN